MSLSAFWPILRKRQVQVVIVASVVAGLRIGLPLALILLVEEQAGDFASAGAVAGAFTLASALSGPPKGRVIDRRGQPRVLVPLAVASALSLVALVLAARSDASVVALIALATLAGLTNAPLFPSMRTLWPDLVDDAPQLETAYSIQAILGEVFYISGPLVAGGCSLSALRQLPCSRSPGSSWPACLRSPPRPHPGAGAESRARSAGPAPWRAPASGR